MNNQNIKVDGEISKNIYRISIKKSDTEYNKII
jgi:hypothetical protein